MKLSSITTQPVWKLTVKISALGLSLVFLKQIQEFALVLLLCWYGTAKDYCIKKAG